MSQDKIENRYGTLLKEIRMGMNLVDRDEFNATISAISHIAADTVKKTLGPYAHTTIIDDGNFVYPTKDGWAVLSRLRFQDPTHNSLFNMLKNVSGRVVDKVGDGTTTAMVAADHFMDEMSSSTMESTLRQKDVVDSLNKMREILVKEINNMAVQIAPSPDEKNPDYQAIYNVAYTSSNGNEKLASIMQEIYQKTNNPNVLVDMEGGTDISYEIQTGYRLDCEHLMHERYINTTEHYFSSNHQPHLFTIFDHSVNYQKHGELIQFIMNYADHHGMRPVFMAPYYDDIVSSQFAYRVQTFLKAHPGVVPNVIVIQIPEMNTKLQKFYVRDFAALAGVPVTDATKVKVFMELRHNERVENPEDHIRDQAMNVEGYNFTTAQALMESCFAVVNDFTIGKNFISLANGNFDSVIYKERYAEAKEAYDKAIEGIKQSPTALMKDYLEASQRLNKLSGALGVIHVGGVTDLERQCNRDIVDDTFRACRSAYENGILPGMNMGTLVAITRVMNQELSSIDRNTLSMLYRAYKSTTKDILTNKKKEGTWKWTDGEEKNADDLINTIINKVDVGEISGYDVVSEEILTDTIPAVSNSSATDVEILYAIIGILGMILTSDQYLSVNRMYDKSAAIRQQEMLNELTTKNQVNSILTAIDEYINTNGESSVIQILQAFLKSKESSPYAINLRDNAANQYGNRYADYLLDTGEQK